MKELAEQRGVRREWNDGRGGERREWKDGREGKRREPKDTMRESIKVSEESNIEYII